MFHRGFKHSKTTKALGLRPRAFISFLVFETPMKHSHSFFKYYFSNSLTISCNSFPIRASYSDQVDGFRNAMKNELKTRPCLKRFQTRMQIFHIDKATKTRGNKQLYLITYFTKQTLNLNYLLLTLNVTVQLLNYSKQKMPFFF